MAINGFDQEAVLFGNGDRENNQQKVAFGKRAALVRSFLIDGRGRVANELMGVDGRARLPKNSCKRLFEL